MDDAELQRELNDALGVSPSPDFVARVRLKIAEPQAAPTAVGWRFPAAAAASLAVVAAVIALRPDPMEPARRVDILGSRPINAVAQGPIIDIAPPGSSRRSNIARPIRSRSAEIPEVLIAADNRLGLMQLLDGVRERRFEATFDDTPASTAWTMSALTLDPLTVEPLAIEPLSEPLANN